MKDYLNIFYSDKNNENNPYPQKLVKNIINLLDADEHKHMLEMGIGMCDHAKIFKSLGLNIEGFDISNVSFERGKELEIPVELFNCESEKWPYDDNSFDYIYSKSFIEHMTNPLSVLLESHRVLNTGGKIITLTPDWEKNFKRFYDDFTHFRPFTTTSLKKIHEAAGFKVLEVKRIKQLPFTWNSKFLDNLMSIIGMFVPTRCNTKILRWSRELMIVVVAQKI